MNDAQILLQVSFEKITKAIQEEKWHEAYQACDEILRYDNQNREALKLKTKIENEVRKINQQAVKDDLNALKELWNQKKYEDLLLQLQKMKSFFHDYPEFAKLYQKAQKKYQEKVYQEREANFKKNYESIIKTAQSGEYGTAIKQAENIQLPNFYERNLQKLIKKIRSEWIQSELKKNENLLKTDRFEEILFFLQNLKHIDEKSQTVIKLINKTKKTYQIYKIESKREFIYQSSEQIRTLYQLKKYEKVIQACHEVLDIEPTNREIRSFLRRAQKQLARQIQNETISQMLSAQKKYADEFKLDKNKFKRI